LLGGGKIKMLLRTAKAINTAHNDAMNHGENLYAINTNLPKWDNPIRIFHAVNRGHKVLVNTYQGYVVFDLESIDFYSN
jgi:hypothetical protein